MAEKNKGGELECIVIKTWQSSSSQDGSKKTEIRSVEWKKDGKGYKLFEKREFYNDEQYGWKMGKAKGFNLKDVEFCAANMPAIMASLGSKLPEHKETAPASAPAANNDDF